MRPFINEDVDYESVLEYINHNKQKAYLLFISRTIMPVLEIEILPSQNDSITSQIAVTRMAKYTSTCLSHFDGKTDKYEKKTETEE